MRLSSPMSIAMLAIMLWPAVAQGEDARSSKEIRIRLWKRQIISSAQHDNRVKAGRCYSLLGIITRST